MLHVCHRAKHPQSGDCIWDDVRRIELDDASEINWTHIECGENYERCRHCVWFHFPDLRGTAVERLGTAKFLGREPMQRHDAIAYILNGIRYHATGCGFRGGYARPANIPAALRRFNHDSRYWFEDVIGPDGVRIAIPVSVSVENRNAPAAASLGFSRRHSRIRERLRSAKRRSQFKSSQ